MAIPVIIENFLQVLLGISDTYFVSKISGQAIAAVGMTNLLMNVLIAFFIAIGTGAVALTARAHGSGDENRVDNIARQAIVLSLYIGVVLGLVLYITRTPILKMLGAEGQVLALGHTYFKSVAIPSVILSLLMVVSSLFKSVGNTKITMKVGILMNGVNILLDIILIFGFGPIPPMGILGAGLATTFARLLGAIILLYVWLVHHDKGKTFSQWLVAFQLRKSGVYNILKIGIPAGLEKLFMRFGQLIYGWMIIKIGTADYIGHNIAGAIESVSYLPAMGFGVASSVLVGQYLGAGQKEKAKTAGLSAFIMGSVMMMVIAIAFFFGGEWLTAQYTDDPLVIEKSTAVLKLIALFQPFLCSTMVVSSALQGAGETKIPMVLTLLGIWGLRITGVYVFGLQMGIGLFGVWIAYVLDIVFRGSLLVYFFVKGKWQSIELLDPIKE